MIKRKTIRRAKKELRAVKRIQKSIKLLQGADSKEIGRIENTPYLWAELKWAAKNEKVVHLDDLLLRRTRIGLLLENGGKYLMKQIRDTVASDLEWDEHRWKQEIDNYNLTWKNYYSPKAGD